MARELELKMLADEAFDERALLDLLRERAAVGGGQDHVQRDVYLDTPNGELAAAGLSARLRSRAGVRRIDIKPVPIEPRLVMDRAEISADVPDDCDPGEALRELLRSRLRLSLSGDPVEQLGLRTARTTHRVETETLKAELAIDRVHLDGAQGFTELELELVEGDPEALRALAESISELPGLSPSGESKYQRARARADLPPYAYRVASPRFGADATVGTVARQVCLALYRTMRAYEPGTRVGLDSEHLHKMRVATRRLRTALRAFRRCFDRDRRKALEDELKGLGRQLGEVRDLDVQLLALPGYRARFGEKPASGWHSLEQALLRRHHAACERLLAALDDRSYRDLCARAEAMFDPDATDRTEAARAPVEPVGARMLSKRIAAFQAAVARFRQTHAAEDAHRLRIVGKRLRYTAEFLEPLLDDELRARTKELRGFQDRLGEIQDMVAAGELARDLRDEALDGGDVDGPLLYVLGELAGAASTATALVRPLVDHALDELQAEALLRRLRAAAENMGH